jgi:peptidoglycan/LPS O-acetylase OafA/YrhL
VQPRARHHQARRRSSSRTATLLVAACAASAGAHAALVPAHVRDQRALGLAFVLAAAALVAVVAALAVRPGSRTTSPAAAVVLASLIGAYALSVTTGIPWLAGSPEPVDVVGLATKTVEALGLAFALRLSSNDG